MTAAPDRGIARFIGLGARQAAPGRLTLGPVDLVVVPLPAASGSGERLLVGGPAPPAGASEARDAPPAREAGAAVVTDPGDSGPSEALRLVALGWATVEAERAAAEFGKDLVEEAREDAILGARGHTLSTSGPLRLILLEPQTEGRLAAALARHGEGPVALYLEGGSTVPGEGPRHMTATGRQGRLAFPSRGGPFVIRLDGS
jgi:hypothetical protein